MAPSATTPASNSSSSARNNWWRQSVVRRTVSFVENDLHQVLAQSPFLQDAQPGDHIALFHRSEIVTGARLGRGGFSYVYEITSFQLDPRVSSRLTPAQRQLREQYRRMAASGEGQYAIKHLQERLLSNPKAFQCAASDLAVEAAYMSALDHPNILPVRGLPVEGLEALGDGRHDGYFLILDRMEDTLDKRVAKWRQKEDASLSEKSEYAIQLASALEYLHERNIVFRDLKPHNVAFAADSTVKLLDFGLCRELPTTNSATACLDQVFDMSGVGTRRYMAVEIVNTMRYNSKADVYGWSMVFWEMLQLEKPYPIYSVEDHKIMVCQQGERPPLNMSWPLAIQNLLRQAWCESVRDRLSMKEARSLLQSIQDSYRMLEVPESPVAVHDESLFVEEDPSTTSLHGKIHQTFGALAHLEIPSAAEFFGGIEEQQQDHRMMSVTLEDNEVHDLSEASDIRSLLDSSLLGLSASNSSAHGVEIIAQGPDSVVDNLCLAACSSF